MWSRNSASACTVSSTDKGDIVPWPPVFGPSHYSKNVWKKLKSRNYMTIKHARIARGKGLRYTWHFSIILISSRVRVCRFQFFRSCKYISALKSFSTFFCRAYISSCHEIASDAKYWTIRALFIAMTTSCLEESAPAQEFPVIQCSCEFLRILVHWICCLFEATSTDNHCKASYRNTPQRDQGLGWTQIIRSELS